MVVQDSCKRDIWFYKPWSYFQFLWVGSLVFKAWYNISLYAVQLIRYRNHQMRRNIIAIRRFYELIWELQIQYSSLTDDDQTPLSPLSISSTDDPTYETTITLPQFGSKVMVLGSMHFLLEIKAYTRNYMSVRY